MQKIEYINGFKVTNNYQEYTLEEEKKVNQIILQKLYDIFFNNKG